MSFPKQYNSKSQMILKVLNELLYPSKSSYLRIEHCEQHLIKK